MVCGWGRRAPIAPGARGRCCVRDVASAQVVGGGPGDCFVQRGWLLTDAHTLWCWPDFPRVGYALTPRGAAPNGPPHRRHCHHAVCQPDGRLLGVLLVGAERGARQGWGRLCRHPRRGHWCVGRWCAAGGSVPALFGCWTHDGCTRSLAVGGATRGVGPVEGATTSNGWMAGGRAAASRRTVVCSRRRGMRRRLPASTPPADC